MESWDLTYKIRHLNQMALLCLLLVIISTYSCFYHTLDPDSTNLYMPDLEN